MKKSLSILLVVFMLVMTLAPSVLADTGDVNIRMAWWGSQTRHDRTIAAIELYMQQHPNVKIEYEFAAWANYWERLATLVASNDLPDIIQQDMQYIQQYASKDQLLDLMPYVTDSKLDLSDVDVNYYNAAMLGDKLYALNLGNNSLMQVYDPVLFAELGVEPLKPGYTWDDYIAFVTDLRTKLPEDMYVTSALPGAAIYHIFYHYLRQKDLKIYDPSGTKLGYEDPLLLAEVFKMELPLIQANIIPPIDVRLEVTSVENDLIVTKQVAMTETNSNQFIAMQKAAGRPLAATVLPLAKDQVKNGQYIKPSQFFSVTSTSKHPDVAVDVINFFTNDIDANKILLAERGVPIAGKVRSGILPLLDENNKVVFDFIEVAAQVASQIELPEPPGHPEVDKIIQNIHQEVMNGLISPEDGAQRFYTEASAVLAKNQ